MTVSTFFVTIILKYKLYNHLANFIRISNICEMPETFKVLNLKIKIVKRLFSKSKIIFKPYNFYAIGRKCHHQIIVPQMHVHNRWYNITYKIMISRQKFYFDRCSPSDDEINFTTIRKFKNIFSVYSD